MSTVVAEHAFVVPAYGRSPYLEDCLRSLVAQAVRSPVVVCTSTPYDGLATLCERYGARLVVHSPNRGIAHDWNYAFDSVDSEWVTIAHQDDVYLPRFTALTMAASRREPGAVLVFTGYREADQHGVRPRSIPLKIKRVLIALAMLGRQSVSSRFSRTNLLRLGCPIPCPSVTLRKAALPAGFRFDPRLRVNLDWDFWLRIATTVNGSFVREKNVLMLHRIHLDSETTSGIVDGVRAREDRELFERLWPPAIAAVISRLYAFSYSYNKA